MLQMDFIHLATLLSQSVNLYRMNGQHEIELVVGDKTETFPNGSLSGLESGYMGQGGHGSRINQYTSMTQIWDEDETDNNDGVMLLGTLDEGSLLRPMIQIMNGDVLKMSEDEWKEKVNYLKVLIQLLVEKNLSGDSATAEMAHSWPPNLMKMSIRMLSTSPSASHRSRRLLWSRASRTVRSFRTAWMQAGLRRRSRSPMA